MYLSEAIDRYLADRQHKGLAAGTVRNERTVLRNLLACVGNINVSSITTQRMDVFWARNAGWSPGTWNRARTTMSVFFKWCQARGLLSRFEDPLEGTRKRKNPMKDRLIIPESEWPALLDAATDPRDRMIVAFGLYLFTRVSETCNLRWRDLDLQNHEVSVFRRKTQTIDVLPLCEELEHEVKVWRLKYAEIMGEVPKPGWVITPPYAMRNMRGVPGRKGVLIHSDLPPVLIPNRQMTSPTERVQRVLRAAGYDLEPGEGGHTLRRSGATALYHELSDRGHDRAIRLVQAMLGHSSVQTTEVYLALNLDRKARNDLLAGKRMFTSAREGKLLRLEKAVDGQENTGAL